MCNKEHGRLSLELINSLCKSLGRCPIQIAGRFVEDQNPRPLEQRPGNGDALLLPARQSRAVFANLRLIALRQASMVS